MAHKDARVKDDLSSLLRSKGFEVCPIDTSDDSTPDLAASDGETAYLIEIKQKLPRAAEKDEIETGVRFDRLGRRNRLSGIIKKAINQLQGRQTKETINLMWFFAECPDQHLEYERLRATVYGIGNVLAIQDGKGVAKEGYYVTHSEFYPGKDVLDGVALENLGAFFLNDHSPRYELTKKSQLVKLFGKAVCDPKALEDSGNIYLVDAAIDPNDNNAVKHFLENKYGITGVRFTELSRMSA